MQWYHFLFAQFRAPLWMLKPWSPPLLLHPLRLLHLSRKEPWEYPIPLCFWHLRFLFCLTLRVPALWCVCGMEGAYISLVSHCTMARYTCKTFATSLLKHTYLWERKTGHICPFVSSPPTRKGVASQWRRLSVGKGYAKVGAFPPNTLWCVHCHTYCGRPCNVIPWPPNTTTDSFKLLCPLRASTFTLLLRLLRRHQRSPLQVWLTPLPFGVCENTITGLLTTLR